MTPGTDTGRNDVDASRGAAGVFQKWGPFVAVLASIALLCALVVFDDGSGQAADAAGDQVASGATGGSGEEAPAVGAPPPVGDMPLTYAEADEAGTVGDFDWGPNCDPATGKAKVPSVYAAPCVPLFEGDNGGSTSAGVTADSLKVVWYDVSEGAGLASLLGSAGLSDSPEAQFATLSDWVELYGAVTQTYGRTVELVHFKATGGLGDAVASQADATRITQDIEPFAVLGGPPSDGGAFARELARNGVICLGCTLGMPECKVLDNAPYLWGTLPSNSQFIAGLRAWMTPGEHNEGLGGRAEFAGDPELAARQRQFGVVHFEQDPPVMTQCPDFRGWPEDFTVAPYLLDFATMGLKAAEIMAKMSSAGVTTIIFAGDPIMPIYLTNAAEAIDYHPEWIFTGTALTDTSTFGRLYNQSQMAHAFGVAQLGVPVAPEAGGALALYRWYFGADAFPAAKASYAVLLANVPQLFAGIQLAGPALTPQTFERALFRIPPAGGDPVHPQVSYGRWGIFDDVDYNGNDDLAEIWWDPTASGPDEAGRAGLGMWRFAHGGERFTPDDPPDPAPFERTDTVTRFEEIPPAARPPEYPPPPGSPAADT